MRPSHALPILVLGLLAVASSCRSTVVEPVLPPDWTEADAATPLTHAACIELAMRSAPTAAAWTARRAAARANADQASLLPNPSLSLGWEDLGLAHTPVQTTASLAVALADVLSRGRRRAAAAHDLEAEEASVRAECNRLAAEVAHAYDELAAARAKVELLVQLADVAEVQRAAAAKFVESGLAPTIQAERAALELASTRADLAKARAEERSLEVQFAFSLGFERPVPLQLAEPMTAATRTTERDILQLLAVAARERPEIAEATARYGAELERAHLASERIQFLPTVSGGLRTTGGDLSGVAGLDVVLPIFDSGATAEHVQDAATCTRPRCACPPSKRTSSIPRETWPRGAAPCAPTWSACSSQAKSNTASSRRRDGTRLPQGSASWRPSRQPLRRGSISTPRLAFPSSTSGRIRWFGSDRPVTPSPDRASRPTQQPPRRKSTVTAPRGISARARCYPNDNIK
jgi:hypothetical protein